MAFASRPISFRARGIWREQRPFTSATGAGVRQMKVVAALALGLLPLHALAKCADGYPPNLEVQFGKAANIFLGSVTRADSEQDPLSSSDDIPALTADVALIETFKGRPAAKGRVFYAYEQHGILLRPGHTYLFVLSQDNFVTICTGSMEMPVDERLRSKEQKEAMQWLRTAPLPL
jgi:hypothetical protein